MRIRLLMASLAAALAFALCAVTAFASETETVIYSSDYGTVSVQYWSGTTLPDGLGSGIYRDETGLTLVSVIPGFESRATY